MADILVTALVDAVSSGPSTVEVKDGAVAYNAHQPVDISPSGGGETVEVQVEVERAVTYYKRGYYPAGSAFEHWQTNDPEGTNPSGNPLIDVTIVASSDGS